MAETSDEALYRALSAGDMGAFEALALRVAGLSYDEITWLVVASAPR